MIAEEPQLMQDLVNGSLEAFDVIYRRYSHAVYCNALKLTKDTTLAEDILQEVFLALWHKKETIDNSHSSIGGWLFTVCYRCSVNLLRKQLKESICYSEIIQEAIHPLPEEEMLQKNGQWSQLEQAIAKLSPQKRKVVELCKLDGKTYEEAATTLNISKHTVKEYLMTAMSSLKEIVSG